MPAPGVKLTPAGAEALLESAERGQIRFIPNPVQKQFIENRPFPGFTRPADWDPDRNPRTVDLFSCRAGEGKSAAIVWSTYFYTKYNPGAACLIFRDTWENCRDTTQKEFFEWFPENVFGSYIKSEKLWEWLPWTGLKGTVNFLGMDDPKDAGKLQSKFFGMFGCDEPSPAAGTGGIDKSIFQFALGRLRQKGMHWYAAKMAQNNPDETHWTHQLFVDPGTHDTGEFPAFNHFQTKIPENLKNLPPGYYKSMMKDLADRPDLQRRMVKGEFGFQQLGKPVTPSYDAAVHLIDEIDIPLAGEMWLSWDGGHTPVCVIGIIVASGVLLITDAIGILDGGTYQLIEDKVLPILETRYAKFRGQWEHTGDPTLETTDQSDTNQSPVRKIKRMLGGGWHPGPKELDPGLNPLNRRLSLLGPGGKGMILVCKKHAAAVHYALRGGWHYEVHPGGVISPTPKKNHPHSDFGDAMRYLAGHLFPQGEQRVSKKLRYRGSAGASYTASSVGITTKSLAKAKTVLPKEFRTIP